VAEGSGSQLQHRGQRAVQRLIEYAPASGSLALWVRHADLAPETTQPRSAPAFTNGNTVFYTPAFERLSLQQQTGWLAHEVLHVALRHAQRFQALQRRLGDADLQLFNRCADAIVNSTLSHLAWLELPANAVTLPLLLDKVLEMHRSEEAALLEWDVERLYAAVDDRRGQRSKDRPSQSDGPKAARTRALGGADRDDLRPDPAGADTVAAESEATREWAERLQRGHAGDGAFSLLRTLPLDLPQTRTPWEQVLRGVAARALAHQPALNWSRPQRSWLATHGRIGPPPGWGRKPWEPGVTTSRAVPRVVLVLDVSGSIEPALLERFAAEMNTLARRLEAALVLVVGDDQVREVRHFEPGRVRLQGLAMQGSGGTNFTPLLEEADRHRPDLTVVLTDLQGPARHRPRGTLLWAVPREHETAVPPFGRLLVLR
jgi:predicted metal-dependent peptidase